jgi:predicted nucleic acid-binding protein
MVSRKRRSAVVIDTNVFVRAFLARQKSNPNQQVVRLWLLEKRLQLLVSQVLVEENFGRVSRSPWDGR